MALTQNVGASRLEVAKASVVLAGMSAILGIVGSPEVRAASLLEVTDRSKLSVKSLKKQVLDIGVASSSLVDAVAEAAAEHARQSYYTLWPAPDVALQLYHELEDGRLAGFKVLYQRVLGDGTVLCSQFLSFRPSLH
jgi:hypothetical protein